VIAWGIAVGSEQKLKRFALPGLGLVRGEDDPLLEERDNDSIFVAYNRMLERAAGMPDVEALVLLHEDVEIRDPALPDKVRFAFEDPEVAIVGPVGGIGVTDINWWGCDRAVGSITWEVLDPVRAFKTPLIETGGRIGPGGSGEVHALDGLLLAFSPWAIRNLRFDEALGPGFHGYDVDICFQARRLGRRVVAIATAVAHHNDNVFAYREEWKVAHERFRRKWEPSGMLQLPDWVEWDRDEQFAATGWPF
jgi:hypothetical protein